MGDGHAVGGGRTPGGFADLDPFSGLVEEGKVLAGTGVEFPGELGVEVHKFRESARGDGVRVRSRRRRRTGGAGREEDALNNEREMELRGIVVEEDAVNAVGVGFVEEARKRTQLGILLLLLILLRHLGSGGDLGGKRLRGGGAGGR